MNIEGKIKIKISKDGVNISSDRPLSLSRVFVGKDIDKVLSMIPLLYSLCGKAHSIAAVRAVESAKGIVENPRAHKLRDFLLKLENLREHLWRIFLDWPRLIGNEEKMQELAKCNQNILELMQAMPDDLLKPGCVLTENEFVSKKWQALKISLKNLVFGNVDFIKDVNDVKKLRHWSTLSLAIPADFINHIISNDWCGIGAQDTEYMGRINLADMQARLELPDIFEFVKNPDWQGKCLDTGPLARQKNTPMIQDILNSHGNGVLARNVARLVEVWKIITDEVVVSSQSTKAGGIVEIETSRGRLYHKVSLEKDVVTDYVILAPTEWNFHPQGVAASALAGITTEDVARMIIMSIDPCVDYELEIDKCP